MPRDHVEEEGGDTDEEIETFTSAPESSAQPSSQAQARGPDRLDCLIARVDQMFGMLDPMCSTSQTNLHTSRVRSLHYLLRLTIYR